MPGSRWTSSSDARCKGPIRIRHWRLSEGFCPVSYTHLSLGPLARELEKLAGLAARRGIRLLYHNHARELARSRDGRRELDAILAAVPPSAMALEPDLGWMEIGGGDPAEYLARYRDRCPVIHLKDYYAEGGPLGDIQGRIPERGDREWGCFCLLYTSIALGPGQRRAMAQAVQPDAGL